MKNIINKHIAGALFIGATAFSLTSCSLDEYNPSGEGADQVFKTPEGMEDPDQRRRSFSDEYSGTGNISTLTASCENIYLE